MCCTGLEASLVGKCNDLRTSLSSLRDGVEGLAKEWEARVMMGPVRLGEKRQMIRDHARALRSLLRAERT